MRNEHGIFIGLGFVQADADGTAQKLREYYYRILDRHGRDKIMSKMVSICTDSGEVPILISCLLYLFNIIHLILYPLYNINCESCQDSTQKCTNNLISADVQARYGTVVRQNPCFLHLGKNDEEYIFHKGKKGHPESYGTAGQDAIECVEKVTSLLQSMKFQKYAQHNLSDEWALYLQENEKPIVKIQTAFQSRDESKLMTHL